MTDNTLKEFEDMFDLPSMEDDENEQAEEYGHSAKNNDSFEDLVKDVSEEVSRCSDKGAEIVPFMSAEMVEDPHDIVKDVCSKEHENKEWIEKMKEESANSQMETTYKEEVESIKKEQKMMEANNAPPISPDDDVDDFDILPDQKVSTKEIVEEINEVHEQMVNILNKETVETFENTDQGKDLNPVASIEAMVEDTNREDGLEKHSFDEILVDNDHLLVDGKIKWYLKSPSVMYAPFYTKKKIVLDSCLVGGQVEFSRWEKELAEAQVNVVTEVFDQQVIINQMEKVQQLRNRVKYIGVRVNNQHFLFKRFVPLLRGYLARIQYLKPVLKQEGLVLEHMADIEMYFERLNGLHKSVSDTENNLAAAYEMLSRKVTICMELPPAERYDKASAKYSSMSDKLKFIVEKEKIIEQSISEDMTDFDDLPAGAQTGPKEIKIGQISWGDF